MNTAMQNMQCCNAAFAIVRSDEIVECPHVGSLFPPPLGLSKTSEAARVSSLVRRLVLSPVMNLKLL